MGSRSESISEILMNTKAYEKVRKSNIKEDASFNSLSESIQKTLNEPYSALLYLTYIVDNHAQNDCKKCCKVNQQNSNFIMKGKVMYFFVSY